MSYTIAITSSGQMTLPKHFRDLLSVKKGERVRLDFKEDSVIIRRQKSLPESLAELDQLNASLETPASLAARKKYHGMTSTQMRNAWDDSEEGRAYYKEQYGNEI